MRKLLEERTNPNQQTSEKKKEDDENDEDIAANLNELNRMMSNALKTKE